jgi:hypothetical protein
MSIMQRLCGSEINFVVTRLWDDGFYVKLGDEMATIVRRHAATPGRMSGVLRSASTIPRVVYARPCSISAGNQRIPPQSIRFLYWACAFLRSSCNCSPGWTRRWAGEGLGIGLRIV